MKKSIHRMILLALGLPVLMGVSPNADFVTVLQEKLTTFYAHNNRVKIHLILNQPEYVAGDTAFFMAYVLHGQSQKPVPGKRILNLELFDSKKEKLLHQRIVCKDGLGAGQLVLPEIQPGNYALIAYGDDAADPLVPSPVFQTEIWIGGEKQFAKKQNNIALFPEGGNLVAGLRNKVVALIPGSETAARVTDSSGKSIAQFTTSSSGLVSFYIIPLPGERYYVESPAGKKELVEAKQDGAGLHVEQDGRDLRASVEIPPSSHWRGDELYLVLTSHGSICFSKSIVLEKDAPTTVAVPGSDCAEGIAQLTLFTSKGEVLAERLVWIEPRPLEVQLSLDAKQYQVRKPVKVDIRLKDFKGLPTGGNLSVAVYKDDLFPNSGRIPNFQQSVLLESDLAPGLISFPDLTKATAAELSDYLITRQWGSFQWTEVFTQKEGNAPRGPVSPYYFKGRVISNSGTAIRDSTAISVYLNRNDFVYVIYTKKNGEFEFPLFMDFNNDDLFYAIHYKGKAIHDAYIALQGSPGFQGFVPLAVAGANDDPYTGFSKSKKPILASFHYYLSKPSKNNLPRGEAEYAEFDEVDIDADLGKYKKFSSMTEVLVEVVPAVKHKKIKDQDAVRVFLQESAMYAQQDPLYFIDGEITDSTGYFLALEPDRLSRIKVLRSEKTLRRFGDLGKNGIVIVETKSPDRSHHIPRSKRILRVTGVTIPVSPQSPDYSKSIQNDAPDLRATLLWKPQLTVDKEGKTSVSFYTGDATGSFLVRVEGTTNTGQPFSSEAHFAVSLDQP